MTNIEKFIKRFNRYGEQITKCFTEENCYWFSYILQNRFGGTIVYNPLINHFACKINGHIYDITGDCTDDYSVGWIDWIEYNTIDESHSKRIIRDCILKVEV